MIWASVRSIVWFSGSPASGSPQPLIVWARMTLGRAPSPSASSTASRIAARSWPPRSATSAASSSSPSRDRKRSSVASISPPAPVRSAFRTAPWGRRSRRWYSAFGMVSSRRSRCLPSGVPNRARSFRPQRSSMTRQPQALNMAPSWRVRESGTTRSSAWRFTSTIQRTRPSPLTASSASPSQTLPSSSSASPTMAMTRPGGSTPKWSAT